MNSNVNEIYQFTVNPRQIDTNEDKWQHSITRTITI